jgi:hypothetical protein
LACISSTLSLASSGLGHGASVFTDALLALQFLPADSLPVFAMWTAFPSSDYSTDSAPPISFG